MKPVISRVAKKYNLELVILFGSVAKNRATETSDIDLAIYEKRAIPLSKELLLRKELFGIFEREVDLVFIKKVTPLLLGQIAQGGELLYGNKKQFNAFRIYAMKRYIDFEPYFKLQEKLIHRKLQYQHA